MRKRTILTSLLVGAAAAAAGSMASAQAPANPPVFAFPEEKGNPPPPGAPNQQEALAAYLNGRVNNARRDIPPDVTPPPPPAPPAPGAPTPPPPPGRTLPPIKTIGPVPNPDHIKFTLPDDIPWTGRAGQNQTWNVFGSPTTPGPYIQLMKWWPGAYSGPHMHPNTRYAIVLSGTWWVSSSATQDKTQTYPLPAGTYVAEPPYTYHWDGARNEPAVLLLWGNGPSPNISVDERGMPRVQTQGGARPGGAGGPPGGAPAGARPPGDD